eukprot:TRINITY_DN19658_c0_g1_i2.p2 TRINITY_DN19658_c0_g1~~TRINITY_DN19658_c0_g1_i2.p2  ORF type:complete len:256 (-),score=30.05 TRINITY_DN19658_c0_g1_i2:12-779(-)
MSNRMSGISDQLIAGLKAKIKEDEHIDADRSKLFDSILRRYGNAEDGDGEQSVAERKEKNSPKASFNLHQENSNLILGDVEQFVNGLNQDIPERTRKSSVDEVISILEENPLEQGDNSSSSSSMPHEYGTSEHRTSKSKQSFPDKQEPSVDNSHSIASSAHKSSMQQKNMATSDCEIDIGQGFQLGDLEQFVDELHEDIPQYKNNSARNEESVRESIKSSVTENVSVRISKNLSLIHICRCRRIERCRSRWSPYH